MQELVERAPKLADHLSPESTQHFEAVQQLLVASGLNATVNPRLVRGLDYYSHTVFEWTTDKLGSQSAICGGGRYDAMLEDFGAKNTPGVGWAMGMERIVALANVLIEEAEAGKQHDALENGPDAFIICTVKDEQTYPLKVSELIRRECPDLKVVQNTGSANMSNQLKRADKLGVRCAVLIGEDEMASGSVTLKLLIGNNETKTVPIVESGKARSSILSS